HADRRHRHHPADRRPRRHVRRRADRAAAPPRRVGAGDRPGRPAHTDLPPHPRGVPMTTFILGIRWTAAWARWRLATWQAARAAWINGADLLTTLPPARADLREPCPLCGGRHCAGCETPARVTSTAYGHQPRHDFSEVPPSLRWLAERVHVTFRGTLSAASLCGRHVYRPADGTACRLWARRKLGRELQLGGPRPAGVLP